MSNKWQNFYLCGTSMQTMNNFYLNKTHSMSHPCRNPYFLLPSHQSWAFQNGGACNCENKVHFGAVCFWGTAGVCLWVGRIARVEACSYPPMLKSFTFQQCSLITQAHQRACFYPHSLACRGCRLRITQISLETWRHILTNFTKQTFEILFSLTFV